jgi:hypothetical protein
MKKYLFFEEYINESRFKRGRWTQISPTSDKELDDHFYELINIAYAEIGGHVKIKTPEDVFADKEWTFWKGVDLHGAPDLDLIVWGKNTKYGVKFAGVGHDGERDSRKEYLNHKGKDLKKLGYYGEVSGKLAEILMIKYGVPVVTDENEVQAAIGGKNVEWHGKHPKDNTIPGNGWYSRKIGGGMHTKILVGRPKL